MLQSAEKGGQISVEAVLEDHAFSMDLIYLVQPASTMSDDQ